MPETSSLSLGSPSRRYVVGASLLFLAIPVVKRLYANYRAWMSLGGGGVPYNVFGWVVQSLLRLVSSPARTLCHTTEFDDPAVQAQYAPLGHLMFLTRHLPYRQRGRPHIPDFFAPQRQVPGNDTAMRGAQRESLQRIADTNAGFVELRMSGLEGAKATALWVKDTGDIPAGARISRALGEAAHLHLEADGSYHVILAPKDAKEVIVKRWGQKHVASGGILPHGYIMLYAPADEQELEVVAEILRAGLRFMSGNRSIHKNAFLDSNTTTEDKSS